MRDEALQGDVCLASFCCAADLLLYHGGEAPRTLICITICSVRGRHTEYLRPRRKLSKHSTHRVAAAESAHNQVVNLQGASSC